MLVLYVTVLHL